MSHTQVQWGRGSTSEVAAYAGPVGEVVLNTDDWSLQAQDGSTTGGWVIRPRLNPRIVTGTGSQIVGSTDDVIAWSPTTPSAVTFTLPASPRIGETHAFKYLLTSGTLYTMTVAAGAGQTIDGQPSVTMNTAYQSLELVYIGANLWVVK